jgi:hypothetical protein
MIAGGLLAACEAAADNDGTAAGYLCVCKSKDPDFKREHRTVRI